VDRVVDFIVALEAALVPENDFVGRRLRERLVRLLGLSSNTATDVKQLLNKMYDIRSSLVHGSPIQPKQLLFLKDRDRWWSFEQLVRKVLVTAVTNVPPEETARRSYLSGLYEIDDPTRVEKLIQGFNLIKKPDVRMELVRHLQKDAQTSRRAAGPTRP
jgi:hypothetical protein